MPNHIFKHGMRFHETDLGQLPGVTTVLSQTKSKDGLLYWKQKVGFDIADKICLNSSNRGNELHRMIEETLLQEFYSKSHMEEANELYELMLPIVYELVKEDGKLIEQPTVHPLGFAGTPDLVSNYHGELTVFDWKNSRKPKKKSYISDYFQQVSAYCHSVEYTHKVKPTQAIIVCATYPDKFLPFTDPGRSVEPGLQLFILNQKQINTKFKYFQKRLTKFQNLLEQKDSEEKLQNEFFENW